MPGFDVTSQTCQTSPTGRLSASGAPGAESSAIGPTDSFVRTEPSLALGPPPPVRAALFATTAQTLAQKAQTLFERSRGNPQAENEILQALHEIAFGPQATDQSRREVVLLLRALIPVTQKVVGEFEGHDALVVRDYSEVLGTQEPFYLLTTSKLFPSDEWSAVTAEGVMKAIEAHPRRWAGKDVAEVGTGSGSLAILAALKSKARTISSFDPNPHSPPVARLNALLNACDAEGNVTRPDLLQRLYFAPTPDLLAGAPESVRYDVIFGCIPQVPSTQTAVSDRQLADVYVPTQRPEDLDGFGLLASLLDQARHKLKPGGEIILTISGRPGPEAIYKMLAHRGYVGRGVTTQMIWQHPETDLSGYITTDALGLRAPFEFWVGDQKITAAEAQERNRAFIAARDAATTEAARQAVIKDPQFDVSHLLNVVSFKPLADCQRDFAEKARRAMGQQITARQAIPYFYDTGSEHEPLRARLSTHLSALMGVHVPADVLFLAPNANRLIVNLAQVLGNGKKDQAVYLDPAFTTPLVVKNRLKIVQTPVPQGLSVYSLATENVEDKIRESAAAGGFAVFKAGPENARELYKLGDFLARHPGVTPHVGILWQDPALMGEEATATLILPNQRIFEKLQAYGIDTYSRLSLRALFEETVLAQLQDNLAPGLDFSTLPRKISSTRSAEIENGTKHADLINMGFGESEFPIPKDVLEAVSRELHMPVSTDHLLSLLRHYWAQTRDLPESTAGSFILGAGVHPLITQILSTPSIAENKPYAVMLPKNHYGEFPGTIEKAGRAVALADLSGDPAHLRRHLKESFAQAASQGTPPRVFLINYPANPSGLYYSRDTLLVIAEFCRDHGIILVADEIFYATGPINERTSFFDLASDESLRNFFATSVIGLSGLAKEFGWGGARFGFAFSQNAGLLWDVDQQALERPDRFALRLARVAYDTRRVAGHLQEHRTWLSERRTQLLDTLEPFRNHGLIEYDKPQGGYFVEVDVRRTFGKNGIEASGRNFHDVLQKQAGIKVHPTGWSGNPGTVRLVYSLRSLPQALPRLQHFFGRF